MTALGHPQTGVSPPPAPRDREHSRAAVVEWRSADQRLGALFLAGVATVGALLVAEHAVLARRGKAGLDMATPAPYQALVGRMSRILDQIDALEAEK